MASLKGQLQGTSMMGATWSTQPEDYEVDITLASSDIDYRLFNAHEALRDGR